MRLRGSFCWGLLLLLLGFAGGGGGKFVRVRPGRECWVEYVLLGCAFLGGFWRKYWGLMG